MENPFNNLSDKQKKIVVAVAVAAGGYVAYRWYQNSANSSGDATTVTSSTDADTAGTGVIGSNVGGDENVGNSNNSGTDQIDTNNEWFSEAVDRLANGGWDTATVQSALGDFLTGQSLTEDEATIVRTAVGAMGGYPPNGPTTIKVVPGTTDASQLKAPTGLKVTGTTDSTVSLSWASVDGAKEYRIYRTGSYANVGSTGGTSFTAGGLAPGTKYTFYVAAGLGSDKMGPRSSGVTVTTASRKLTAPTGLKASALSTSAVKLTWNPVYPGEYMIRRSGSSATQESVDPATTWSGLKKGTRYQFQVAAVKPGTRTPGPWSSYVSVTTKSK